MLNKELKENIPYTIEDIQNIRVVDPHWFQCGSGSGSDMETDLI
jgi:hypothetical protein